ncbi:MAG: DUF4231 domain-containing protein [Sulfuricurvum sp.]
MTESDYLEQRLKGQIKWYSTKSYSNQRWFKRLSIIQMISALSIPFVTTYGDPFWAGPLGALIALIAGVLSMYRFHENWVTYRSIAEKLKYHLVLFETRLEPYHDETTRFPLLVKMVEGILSQENGQWQVTNTPSEVKAKG